MLKVLIADKLSPSAVDVFRAAGIEATVETGLAEDALIARSEANLAAIAAWVGASDWAGFLARAPETRSCTSICLSIVSPWFEGLSGDDRAAAANRLVALLDEEGVAYDIGAYRDAPPGLRIWGGATVETRDLDAMLPWLDWAWQELQPTSPPT